MSFPGSGEGWRRVAPWVVVGLWSGCASRCGEPGPPELPDDLAAGAKVDVWRSMIDDRYARRSPSDGGGKARILQGPQGPVVAGSQSAWVFEYEVGEQGVAVGGAVYFQAPAFWGWSPPQTWEIDLPGYTEVHTEAAGVELSVEVAAEGLLRVDIGGRALVAGERLEVGYGIGGPGVTVDRYADRVERFWFAVDGDGDGIRGLVADPPTAEVVAGPAVGLMLTLPTAARPGAPARLTVAALDGYGNAGATLDGAVRLYAPPELGLPETITLGPAGTWSTVVPAVPAGMYQVGAEAGRVTGISDPMLVHADTPALIWADLQVHTSMSDGSGALDDVYAYARDVAGLDAVAITDHDHWGMRFLDDDPAMWEEAKAAAERWYAPGAFVTFPAYEWTSWLYGHRHVLYVGPPGPVFSSVAAETMDPSRLWRALRPFDAITIAHHSAGGPVPVDWRPLSPPGVEPVTEVVSVHGSSESEDTPLRIYGFVPGNTVRDALAASHRFGFIGSTDGHDGHPGLAHLQAAQGGVAGIFTEDRSREGVAAALRARRVYATSGPRLLLRARVDGVEMGGELVPTGAASELEVRVVAGDAVERIDVIRGMDVVEQRFVGLPVTKQMFTLPPLQAGEWVYARVLLGEGGVAWSSPVFVVAQPAAAGTDGAAAVPRQNAP